jgi:hypothetical protein
MLLDRDNNQMMRIFLRICLAATPQLVLHVFRGLQLAEPKPNFRTLSSLTFVDSVVCDAPSPEKVLLSFQGSRSALDYPSDKILPTIVPACVTKGVLGKVIQSSSALIVSCGLKLIITILDRANEFVLALSSSIQDGSTKQKASKLQQTIRQAVLQHLPQMSLLLSIPTRFDPFEKAASQANSVIMLQLCKTIQCYGQLDPSVIINVQFDWVKLLPLETDQHEHHSFMNSDPCCSVAILQLLNTISRLDRNTPSLKMLNSALFILTSTTVLDVYNAARELATSLIESELFPVSEHRQDTETSSCNKYECSLWVDEIRKESIQELVVWIGSLNHHRVQHKIFASQAWMNCGVEGEMPPLRVSMLLSFLISKLIIGETEFSSSLSLSLIQLATKMMIYQQSPLPLASIIVYASSLNQKAEGNTQCTHLCQFAASIVHKGDGGDSSLNILPFTVFNSDGKSISLSVNSFSSVTSSTALRQCLSLIKYKSVNNVDLSSLLRRILAWSFTVR